MEINAHSALWASLPTQHQQLLKYKSSKIAATFHQFKLVVRLKNVGAEELTDLKTAKNYILVSHQHTHTHLCVCMYACVSAHRSTKHKKYIYVGDES